MAMLIGFAIGIFLAVGSAVILRRTLAVMESKNNNVQWSMAQAAGLASLWMCKLAAACVALYFAQRAGYSTALLGLFVPVGIIVGIYAARTVAKT